MDEPFPKMLMNDYESACAAQETHIHIRTDRERNRLLGCLSYENAKKVQGRVLAKTWVDHPELQVGSRLEPSESLRDIGDLDEMPIPDEGLDIVFWKGSHRAKHRNPLFSAAIGITPFLILVDLLHAFYLGVLKSFAVELVWELILSNCWRHRASFPDQPSFLEASVQLMYCDLINWYTQRAQSHPEEKMTRVSDFSARMIGETTKRKLSLKAAETKMFFFFLADRVQHFRDKLLRGDIWCQACSALCRFIAVMKEEPLRISDAGYQEQPGLVSHWFFHGRCPPAGLVPGQRQWLCGTTWWKHDRQRFGVRAWDKNKKNLFN